MCQYFYFLIFEVFIEILSPSLISKEFILVSSTVLYIKKGRIRICKNNNGSGSGILLLINYCRSFRIYKTCNANHCCFVSGKCTSTLQLRRSRSSAGWTRSRRLCQASYTSVLLPTCSRYPVGSCILATYIQRYVAKLDEHGTTAVRTRKDQASKADKAACSLKKVFDTFKEKMYVILSNL